MSTSENGPFVALLFHDDEDGDRTYVEGHHVDWLLRLRLATHLASEWDMSYRDAAERALTCKVTRGWYRMKSNDPDCEHFVKCSRWRRGAYCWTVIEPFEDEPMPWDKPLDKPGSQP